MKKTTRHHGWIAVLGTLVPLLTAPVAGAVEIIVTSWGDQPGYHGQLTSIVEGAPGKWNAVGGLGTDEDRPPYAEVFFSGVASGLCTEEMLDGRGPECNRSGNGTIGDEGFDYFDDLGVVEVEVIPSFLYTLSVDSAVDSLAPVGVEFFLSVEYDILYNLAGIGNGYGELFAYSEMSIHEMEGDLLVNPDGSLNAVQGDPVYGGLIGVATGRQTDDVGQETESRSDTIMLQTNRQYLVTLEASVFNILVPFHLSDTVAIQSSAVSDPTFAIDPSWEHAAVSSLNISLPTAPYSFSMSDADFEPVPVPAPATAWLFAAGLVGVAALRRRRKA